MNLTQALQLKPEGNYIFPLPPNRGILNVKVCLGQTSFQAPTPPQMLAIPVNHSKCIADLFTRETATCQTARSTVVYKLQM